VVRVGDYEVRAVGTAFNVRQRDGSLQVAVSEGHVQVCRLSASGEYAVVANLSAGQLIKFAAAQTDPAASPALVSVPTAQVAEWRMRIVTYEDVTVREVVDDFNRYFDQKLSVAQPELMEQRVTIRLQVEDRERAIQTLAGLLGARVIRTERGDALTQ
jgi:transmembrane sensor